MLLSNVFFLLLLLLTQVFRISCVVFSPPREDDNEQPEVPWHKNWAAVTRCKKGEKHPRWPECWCGQYAVTLEEGSEDLESEGIYTKFKGNRKILYTCLPCSSCPDGVPMTDYCRQAVDTSCDLGKCIDPTYIFDKGRKACVPDPQKMPVPTTDAGLEPHKTTGPTDRIQKSEGPHSSVEKEEKLKNSEPTHWNQTLYALMIAAVTAAVVLALALVIIVAFLAYRTRRRRRQRYRTLNRIPSNLSQLTTASNTARCLPCINETSV